MRFTQISVSHVGVQCLDGAGRRVGLGDRRGQRQRQTQLAGEHQR